MTDLLHTFVTGSFALLLRMFVIVVPIMVVLELFEGSRPFRALVRGWAHLVRRLGMTERRHELSRRQVFLMSVFLSQVHAVIEDSLVFFAVGASLAWTVGFRLLWAVALTAVLGVVASAVVRRRQGKEDIVD